MSEIVRIDRSLEELVDMQSRAIDALHAGIDSLTFALQVINRMVDEQGYQRRFMSEERRMYPLKCVDSHYHHGPYPIPKVAYIEPSSTVYIGPSSDLSGAEQANNDSPSNGVL